MSLYVFSPSLIMLGLVSASGSAPAGTRTLCPSQAMNCGNAAFDRETGCLVLTAEAVLAGLLLPNEDAEGEGFTDIIIKDVQSMIASRVWPRRNRYGAL